MYSKPKRSYSPFSPLSRLSLAFILGLVLVFLTGGSNQSLAASGIWRGTFSNIWNRDNNWMPGGYPNASGEIAVFDGGSAPTNVVISGTPVTVGGLAIVNNTGYTISGEAGGSLVFRSASSIPATVIGLGQTAHTISAPVLLSSNLNITNLSTGLLTFSGDISEDSGDPGFTVDINDGKPVAFSGQNTYSGGTRIHGGTLLLGGNAAAGSGPITLMCSNNPCQEPDTPSVLGNLAGDTVLPNPLIISHQFIQFKGPGSMSFTSLDSRIPSSAQVIITGTLNLAKLQDPTFGRNLRRAGSGTLNLNITPEATNIGAFIRSDPGSGLMNLYGSGVIGRIYYRDGSGGGTVGVGDNLDVSSGILTRSTGVMTVTGVLQTGTNTSGQPDRVLSFDLRGTEPGSGYDQIVIKELSMGGILSTARITDTVLSVAVDPDFDPPIGSEYTLINRTGGDSTFDDVIQGTFRDLPNGIFFLVDDLAFQIHYTEDTVTLTRCENPILTVTGGSPQSTNISLPFQDRLEVTARYPDHSPVVGLKIFFEAPSSGASATFAEPIPVITGPDGKASVAATANIIVGSYEVTASTKRLVVTPVKFYLTNISLGPNYLEVSGYPSPNAAGTPGTFSVTVRDQGNQIFAGYTGTVSFSSSDPGASLPVNYTFTPADAGQHSFSAIFYTAGENYYLRATDTVTPTLTGEQTGIIVLPGDPAQIEILSGSAQSAQVATSFIDPLAVRVTDAYSNTVPGVPVTFSGPLIGASAVFTGTNPVITDLTGRASLIAGANTVSGSYQVSASVETPGVTPVIFSLTNTPGPVVELRVFDYPSPVIAGTIHPFTVTANDRYGNVNPDYRGATFSLSSDSQAILPSDYLFNALDAGRHVFTATFRTVGLHFITIVDNRGLRGTQSGIQVDPATPTTLRIDKATSQSPQSTQVGMAFPKPLAVLLTDAFGNPQSGYTITFTAPSNGAGVILTGANPQITGNDGKASLSAAANTVTGSYDVVVTTNAPGVDPYKFALTNLSGLPGSLTYVSGSMQATPVGNPFAAPLVVEVKDLYGNLATGVWVTFISPLNGPGCVLGSGGQALTGADGRASLPVTANMNVGSYSIEARLDGFADPVLFNLTNKMVLYLAIIFR